MQVADASQVFRRVAQAACAEDVFGDLAGTSEQMLQELRRAFRAMAQLIHPDHRPADAAVAAQAMGLLVRWKEEAEERVRAGCYGRRAPMIEIRLRSGIYNVHGTLRQGEYATLYRCTRPASAEQWTLKVVRRPADNDLGQREVQALRDLAGLNAAAKRYFPEMVDAFLWADRGTRRQAILCRTGPERYTLEEIRRAYPDGIDARDAAWMFNRLLEALWAAHGIGLFHGAVVPANVGLDIENHGAVLEEWAYAVHSGECLRAISARYADWYPPEVLDGHPAAPATDIAMAVRCLVYLLGGDGRTGEVPDAVPRPIGRFVRGCLLAAPTRRPGDAGELREQFGGLLRDLFGEPRFQVFTMPARA